EWSKLSKRTISIPFSAAYLRMRCSWAGRETSFRAWSSLETLARATALLRIDWAGVMGVLKSSNFAMGTNLLSVNEQRKSGPVALCFFFRLYLTYYSFAILVWILLPNFIVE